MRAIFLAALIAVPPAAGPALANDGYGGLTATGLTFGQTEAVQMVSEDLYIGPDRISVDYTFRNITGTDVTGEVIFPLPPVAVWQDSDMNLPEDRDTLDVVGFTATVDGRPVALTIDRIAVIEPEYDPSHPPASAYDTPGTDVTADLNRLGIPVTLDGEKVQDALRLLSLADRKLAEDLGIADFWLGDASQGNAVEVQPKWSVITRYHWTQTFPAGKELRVQHSYTNRPPGSIFGWSHPPQDWQADLVREYCIDDGTSKAIAAKLTRSEDGTYSTGTALYISYVLRTANSWAGPIGHFRLTLDKGSPDNVISLCAEGLKKTGPTTFVMEKSDYTPTDDLNILLAQPYGE